MAQFDALREGFREFNRLLIDAQQWDEVHEGRVEDRKYRNAVLQSNLNQQAFEREMAMKTHTLAKMGQSRLAWEGQERVAHQKRTYDLNMKNHGLSERKVKEIEKSGKKSRRLDQLKIDAEMKKVTPITFRIPVPEHFATDEGAMQSINELAQEMHPDGYVDQDFILRTSTPDGKGVELPMSPNDQAEFATAFRGIIALHNDPNRNAHKNIEGLNIGIQDLKQIIKTTKKPADRGQAKRMVHKMEAQIRKEQQTFVPINSRNSLLQRGQGLSKYAMWLDQVGRKEMAVRMSVEANELFKKAAAADATAKGQMIQFYEEELDKNDMAVGAGKGTYNTTTNTYRYADEEGNIIESTLPPKGRTTVKPVKPKAESKAAETSELNRLDKVFEWGQDKLSENLNPPRDLMAQFPDQSAGIAYVQQIYRKLADMPLLDEEGNKVGVQEPRIKREASELTDKAMQQFRLNHNNAYQDYLVAKKDRSGVRIEEWKESVLTEFGYMPTKPFVKQIWKGKVRIRR